MWRVRQWEGVYDVETVETVQESVVYIEPQPANAGITQPRSEGVLTSYADHGSRSRMNSQVQCDQISQDI